MSVSYLPAARSVAANRGAQSGAGVARPARAADIVCWAILAMIIAGVLLGRMDHAVVPHDDGTIGQAAERVLQGELPHHDFDDVYTGLLSFVNAAAFRLFGVNILATRLVLLTGTVIAFVALYGLCRRVLPAWVALLTATAAFLASVPNYFCPLPTWYNLFFTILALAAMLQFHDTQRMRWVAIAGALTGISFLFKLVGIYFAAAAALFVIFAEQQRSDAEPWPASSLRSYWAGLTIAGLWAYVVVIVILGSQRPRVPELAVLVGPALAIAGFLSWNEWRLRHHGARQRFVRLLGIGAVFFVGLGAVVSLYLLPYFAAGGIGSWFKGVFVSPLRRLDHSSMGRPLPVDSFLMGVLLLSALAGLVLTARRFKQAAPWVFLTAVAAAIALCSAGNHPADYRAVWGAARLTPLAASLAVALSLWMHLRRPEARGPTKPSLGLPHAEETLLIVATAGVFGLVQFPLSHGIYFLYVAPLAVICGAYTLTLICPPAVYFRPGAAGPAGRKCGGKSSISRCANPRKPSRVGPPMAAVLFASAVACFSAVWLLPGIPVTLGMFYYPARWTARIPSARFPITCDRGMAKKYEELIQQVKRHSRRGSAILALPDAPEVYFLTGRRNPTRTFFDAFDSDYATPERDQRLLETIERQQVNVVVLRKTGLYSQNGASQALQNALRRRFPHEKQIFGNRKNAPDFIVRWRDAPAGPQGKPLAEVAHR